MVLTVSKFGGTSMGTAQSIREVASILQENTGTVIAVVSATSGTTDQLIQMGATALKNNEPWQPLFDSLLEKHREIIQELGLDLDLSAQFEEIQNLLKGVSLILELSLSARDRLIGFGERISSHILAALLVKNGVKAQAVSAYDLIFTDNNFSEGTVDFAKTDRAVQKMLKPMIDSRTIPIITGFIAQAENGQYITLGRGGSDYSAAIVAGALHSDILEIWTDVDGIFQADPRFIPKAHLIETMSFNEASELAYFGAKVLHPKTIKPAISKNIPVKILNTFNRPAKGTLIVQSENESIKSVTYKKNIDIINICSSGMIDAYGFLSKIFEVFLRNKIVIDVVSTSEVSVSLTVDKGNYTKALEELSLFATVEVYKDMAIVCLVGNGIRGNTTILQKLFGCISNYTISMVSQGASQRNITFLVRQDQAQEVVTKIFDTFFL